MPYDAIIAGASFAGLVIAKNLNGNILLLDRKTEIGTGQKSTCCTFYHTLKKLGCEESVLQTINTVVLHIGSKDITYHLEHPFATFDYKKLCQILYRKSNTRFLSAKVYGLKENTVMTEKGNFQSECIVDATDSTNHNLPIRFGYDCDVATRCKVAATINKLCQLSNLRSGEP